MLELPSEIEDIFYNGPPVEDGVVDSRELVKSWVEGYKQYVKNTQLLKNPYFKKSRLAEFLYAIMPMFEKWLGMIRQAIPKVDKH